MLKSTMLGNKIYGLSFKFPVPMCVDLVYFNPQDTVITFTNYPQNHDIEITFHEFTITGRMVHEVLNQKPIVQSVQLASNDYDGGVATDFSQGCIFRGNLKAFFVEDFYAAVCHYINFYVDWEANYEKNDHTSKSLKFLNEFKERIERLLEGNGLVILKEKDSPEYPHMFSGDHYQVVKIPFKEMVENFEKSKDCPLSMNHRMV